MTCGLGHREPPLYIWSTRCKYTTHRQECPANFSTKCSDHLVDGEMAPPDPGLETLGADDKKDLAASLKNLEIKEGLKTPVIDKPTVKTPGSANTDQPWGQASLGGLERMIRYHVAQNQQHLNLQTPSQGPYAGPKMSEIRQDPGVQSQEDIIMNTLKAALPVFSQNAPGIGSAPVPLSGINPLQGASQYGQPQYGHVQFGQPQQNQLLQSLFSQQSLPQLPQHVPQPVLNQTPQQYNP